jgi:hypothetical protein
MSKVLNLTEIDDQHVELLPERTVMSLFIPAGEGGSSDPSNATGSSSPFTFGTYVQAPSLASSDPTGNVNVAGGGPSPAGGASPALPDM